MSDDPLSQVITLLQPRAVVSKPITAAGRWAVRYSEFGQPSTLQKLGWPNSE